MDDSPGYKGSSGSDKGRNIIFQAAASTLQYHWRKQFGRGKSSPKVEAKKKRKNSEIIFSDHAETNFLHYAQSVLRFICLAFLISAIMLLVASRFRIRFGGLRGDFSLATGKGLESSIFYVRSRIDDILEETKTLIKNVNNVKNVEQVKKWMNTDQCKPRWVHTSFTTRPPETLIRWSTTGTQAICGFRSPIVYYSERPTNIEDNKVSGKAVPIRHGQAFEALLTDLESRTRYYFMVGFEGTVKSISEKGTFLSPPKALLWEKKINPIPPLQLGIISDSGAEGFPRKIKYTHGTISSMSVVESLANDMGDRNYDAIIHLGDLSYAENYAHAEPISPFTLDSTKGARALLRWSRFIQDVWMRQMKPIFLTSAFHAVPGNHDIDFSHFRGARSSPCWSDYRAIFGINQVSSSHPECMYDSVKDDLKKDQIEGVLTKTDVDLGTLSYGIDYGLAYVYSMLLPFGKLEKEKQQLEKTLASIHKGGKAGDIPPWLIVAAHTCFLSSKKSCYGKEENMATFSTIFETSGVDLILFGHAHVYERSYLGKNKGVRLKHGLWEGTVYKNPDSPIYINAGLGGATEAANCEFDKLMFEKPQPSWSKRRFSVGCFDRSSNTWNNTGFGFGRLTIHNRTHLEWETVMVNGTVADRILIVKYS